MSSFVVGTNTIHNAVSTLIPSAMTGDESGTKMGKNLLLMNIDAVCQVYDISPGSPEHARYMVQYATYKFVESKEPDVQLLKSLGCLTYQCAEGDVPETNPLFERCEKHEQLLKELLASDGINLRSVPGYDKAKWDY